MNKSILTLIILFTAISLKAQDSTSVDPGGRPAIYWLYHNNYNLATRYNDLVAAKSALYSLINIEPENDSLKFNLAYLYFDNQQFPSSVLVCMDILAQNPQHAPALEISAIAYEELGLKEKSLTNYEQHYLATDNIESLYKLTFIQYDLKRYGECEVNLGILLQNPNIDTRTMLFQTTDTERKQFSLRVAILNLSGLLKKSQGDIAGARATFNQVLELAPDFVFAANNLAELDK